MQTTAELIAPESPDLRQTIKTLSRVRVTTSLYHLVEVWSVIAVAMYVSSVVVPLSFSMTGAVVYLCAVAIIASRQHALMVLTHEGIHKRLARTLWVNDWLARLLAAFPVCISLAKWRFIHLSHHQYTHTANDPDRAIYARYPLAHAKATRLLLSDFCGRNVITTVKYFIDIPFVTEAFNRRFLGEERVAQYRQVADMRAFTVFWLVVLVGGLYLGGLQFASAFVLYWLAPYCTFTQVFFRIRGAIEHGSVPDPGNPYQQTRTYLIHPLLAFFFAPKQVNYHLEHHLYPSVPFYHLPRLHAVLQQTVYPQVQAYCESFTASLDKLTS
jgi:fatty acid desaturase